MVRQGVVNHIQPPTATGLMRGKTSLQHTIAKLPEFRRIYGQFNDLKSVCPTKIAGLFLCFTGANAQTSRN